MSGGCEGVGRWLTPALTKKRRLVETVLAQLTETVHLNRVWARDLWHLTSRTLRKILSHTFVVFPSRQFMGTSLRFEQVL